MDWLDTHYGDNADAERERNMFIRRLYFGVEANLAENISGKFVADFDNDAEGIGDVETALITLGLNPYHSLSAGYTKVPFGAEETTSNKSIPAVERSIVTNYFSNQLGYGARFTGLFFNGQYDNGSYFELALTNAEGKTVSASTRSDSFATWGNIGWTGTFGSLSLDTGLVHGYIPDMRQDGLEDHVLNAYMKWDADRWHVLTELYYGDLENAQADGNGDSNPLAYHIMPVYRLSENFDLVGRFASLDTDMGVGADIGTVFRRAPELGGADYDRARAYYLGGNWYIHGNSLKLSAGYEWVQFDKDFSGQDKGDANSHGIRTRLQLLF